MNLLFYTPVVGRGGMRLVIQTLLQGMARYAPEGWHIHILGQQFDEDGLPVDYPAELPFTQLEPVDRLPLHPDLFQFLWTHQKSFYQHLERLAPDFDLIFCIPPWWGMQVLDWTIQTPFIAYVPDLAWDFINVGNILTMHFEDVTRRLKQHAVMTVFSAEFHRQHAVERYALLKEKTRVIQSSADYVVSPGLAPAPEQVERVRAKYRLPDRYLLAFHCMYHKDVITILRAHGVARAWDTTVPPLVLAGINTELLLAQRRADGYIADVKRLIGLLGEDAVIVAGRIAEDDIAPLFAGADASISASLSEGDLSGNTLTAFMTGCPHIYSDLPVYIARIGYDRYGYFFPRQNFTALAQCIMDIHLNPGEGKRRASAARLWALQRTLKDVIGEYIEMFEQVAHGSTANAVSGD